MEVTISTFVRLVLTTKSRVTLLTVATLSMAAAVTLAARPLLGANTPVFEVACWVTAFPCVCQFVTEMVDATRQYVLGREQSRLDRAEFFARACRQIGQAR
ncbi:MAG TPA: hypothetical protein VNT26_12695 [Candidatus Sulfotelmatobacter sp.]|nr:hypothetical protein [Candidatus Sulfotelmatobacter sp.]